MIMMIMVIVFSNMFRFDIQNYPVYLIIGQTVFNFVSESTNQAMWSITGNASLLNADCSVCMQGFVELVHAVYSSYHSSSICV